MVERGTKMPAGPQDTGLILPGLERTNHGDCPPERLRLRPATWTILDVRSRQESLPIVAAIGDEALGYRTREERNEITERRLGNTEDGMGSADHFPGGPVVCRRVPAASFVD